MPTIELALPELHGKQRLVWDSKARFLILRSGRRFGKSRLGALMCIASAADGGRVWWISPSYPMSAIGWRMLKQLAVQIPDVQVRVSDRMIVLPSGGSITVRSADNPDSLRGESLDFVVLDECAFMGGGTWTEAIRPALADRQGRALFISTPKGRNWFYTLWMQAQSLQEWATFHFTSYDNPYIPAGEIDAAKDSLPSTVFSQEFLAEFIEDGGIVFRRIAEATTATWEDEPRMGVQYAFGVDWARSGDFTVITVLDMQTNSVVHIDRFNQVDYVVQVHRLQALYERFRPRVIVAEANSMGAPLIDTLQRMALPVQPFTTTNATKTQIIDSLALAFERGDIRIPNHTQLVAELQAFEMTRLPSGLIRYGAPEGMHDDCVMSLALVWEATQSAARDTVRVIGKRRAVG